MTNLRSQASWDQSYAAVRFAKADESSSVARFLKNSAAGLTGECIEIGCFPGQFLPILGDLGLRLNGIDLAPGTDDALPTWLRGLSYEIGQFVRQDFTEWAPEKSYSFVYSLGFLEHFVEWPSIIAHHAKLVVPGGTIVLGAPNFSGILQRILHKFLDGRNYSTHYVPSMNTEAWSRVLELLGFDVTYAGPLGGFDFWAEGDVRSPVQDAFLGVVQKARPYLMSLPDLNGFHTSSYLALAAKRRPQVDVMQRYQQAAPVIEMIRSDADEKSAALDTVADGIISALKAHIR
ncbi:class I SAM-dependent methyltransferase [Arenibaculum pallidiluteum]|uniref:class I SAM-dependent methyltransferase n=1 Tax=Arenibaculum pallidiluteum TaxID=2812559 RepID=UPI001A9684EB|nr:methyltransferase domain-containing protein [Arenibaculum pallidiluteum]